MAQGSVVVSGFGVSARTARASASTCERRPCANGATVEHEVHSDFASQPFVMLNLNTPDFTTASHLSDASTGCSAGPPRSHLIRYRQGIGTDRHQSTHRLRVAAAGAGNRAGRCPGTRDHQFAHRYGGHRLARARDAAAVPMDRCRSRSPNTTMSASPTPSARARHRSLHARHLDQSTRGAHVRVQRRRQPR